MARTATLPILNGESGLSRYLAEIRKFPMLEPQQEYMFAKRWREHDDRDAAHHLVTSHLRLVAKIAMGYRGYGLPISEVVSEGNVGLMQAVKRFEPEKGFRLATYAMWWIKGVDTRVYPAFVVAREDGHHREPEEAVLQPAQGEEQDLRPGRGRSSPRPGEADCQAPRRDGSGRGRHEPPSRRRLRRSTRRFATTVRPVNGRTGWVDTSPNQEAIMAEHEEFDHRRQALNGAIGVLNPRERRIFEARRLAEDPMTLEDLAAEFGVSRERVRQIEVRAFEKVQSAVKGTIARRNRPALEAAY